MRDPRLEEEGKLRRKKTKKEGDGKKLNIARQKWKRKGIEDEEKKKKGEERRG